MTHQLNTCLYLIIGRAELLQHERPNDPIVQEHIEVILKQAEQIQDILTGADVRSRKRLHSSASPRE